MPNMPRSVPSIRGAWSPDSSRDPENGRCKPSCCKTPHGHAPQRDHIPLTHKGACRCHIPARATPSQEATS